MNLYQYCGNNPTNWVDPLGLVTGVEETLVAKCVIDIGLSVAVNIYLMYQIWQYQNGLRSRIDEDDDRNGNEKIECKDGGLKNGKTVLGKFPDYIKLADELGAIKKLCLKSILKHSADRWVQYYTTILNYLSNIW